LQELKTPDDRFPADALAELGYSALGHGQQRWNGVALLSRVGELIETRRCLPDDPDPDQSRYIEAAVCGLLVGNMYAPNGNPKPGPKFDYKLAWLDRLNGATLLALRAAQRNSDDLLNDAGFWYTRNQAKKPPVRDRSSEFGATLKAASISMLEIEAALKIARDDNAGGDGPELVRTAARLLGFRRVGSDLQARIAAGLEKFSNGSVG